MSLINPSVTRSFQQSPNYTKANRSLASITALLIHWWNVPSAGATHGGVVSWFLNEASKVSAHYVISAGRLTQQVKEKDIAWHAGPANPRSIGLELSPYCTEADYQTAAETIADIWRRAGRIIPLQPHRQHMQTACPGDWDLAKLHRMALAIYRGTSSPAPKPAASTPAPASSGGSSKPWPAGRGPWPDAFLAVRGERNEYQDRALHKLLGDTPQKWTGNLAQRLQKHLRHHGYYKGSITAQSQIGPQTIRAWQGFLKDRGYYTGSITAQSQWGPQTTRATVNFLNDQAKLYHR